MKRKTNGIAFAIASLLVGASTASGSEHPDPHLKLGTYDCKPLSEENYADPPPVEPRNESKDPKLAALERAFADANKIKVRSCPSGKIAYPRASDQTGDANVEPKTAPTFLNRSSGLQTLAGSSQYREWVTAKWERASVGGFVRMNIGNPTVYTGVHSLGQLLFGGPGGSTVYTLEMGWRKWGTTYVDSPYYDGEPHLFTFINRNGYSDPSGYCYDCQFVPSAGASYVPTQTLIPSEPPFQDVTLEFGAMRYGGNWWLWVGDEWIGYINGSFWPSSFNTSATHSYYGEVSIWKPGFAPVTGNEAPEMGNGNNGNSSLASVMKTPSWMSKANDTYTVHQESVNDSNADLTASDSKYYNYGNVSSDGRFWRWGGARP